MHEKRDLFPPDTSHCLLGRIPSSFSVPRPCRICLIGQQCLELSFGLWNLAYVFEYPESRVERGLHRIARSRRRGRRSETAASFFPDERAPAHPRHLAYSASARSFEALRVPDSVVRARSGALYSRPCRPSRRLHPHRQARRIRRRALPLRSPARHAGEWLLGSWSVPPHPDAS